jgi:hypothetical protein
MNRAELKSIVEGILEVNDPSGVISEKLEEELKNAQVRARNNKKAIHDAEQTKLREYFLGKTGDELRDELKTMISGDLYEFHNELERTDEVAELLLLKFVGEVLIADHNRLFNTAVGHGTLFVAPRGMGDLRDGQHATVTVLARDLGYDDHETP